MMKYYILPLLLLPLFCFSQSVGINQDGSQPNGSAILDIKSSTKGLLIPRLNTSERNLLSGPTGLMVFDQSLQEFYFYKPSGWTPFSHWRTNFGNIYHDASSVGIGLNNPKVDFHVGENKWVLFGRDTTDTSAKTFLWNPIAGALKAGSPFGSYWDIDSTGQYSVGFGLQNVAKGDYSISVGFRPRAMGRSSMALGENAQALGDHALALGLNAISDGSNSVSIFGKSNGTSPFTIFGEASGFYPIAIGVGSKANSGYSFGFSASAGQNAIALGHNAKADSISSISIGNFTEAKGRSSLALGIQSTTEGFRSMSIGAFNEANGEYATSFGNENVSDGEYSAAIGRNNNSIGDYSMAFGNNTITRSYGEIALGQYNFSETQGSPLFFNTNDILLTVGNGTFLGPSNALMIRKNGNIGINHDYPSEKLHVHNANLYVSNDNTTNGSVGIVFGRNPDQAFEIAHEKVGVIDLLQIGKPNSSVSDYALRFWDDTLINVQATLRINEAYNLPKIAGSANQVLVSGGGMNTYWEDFDKNSVFEKIGDNIRPIVNSGSENFLFGLNDFPLPSSNLTSQFFYYNKDTGAFRGGKSTASNVFSADSLGNASFAWGNNVLAKGLNSASFGNATRAIGSNSMSIGNNNSSLGIYSLSGGSNSVAESSYSLAFGDFVKTTTSHEVVIGRRNTSYIPANNGNWSPEDRLFVIGNGTGAGFESDALIVKKSGDMSLHGELTIDADGPGNDGEYVLPGQDGAAGQVLTTNGSGLVEWSINANTDDQKVDQFEVDNHTLLLSLESDNETVKSVSLLPYLDNTDEQDLSLVGTQLSILNGNSVDISQNSIADVDESVSVETEKSGNLESIIFTTSGVEAGRFDSNGNLGINVSSISPENKVDVMTSSTDGVGIHSLSTSINGIGVETVATGTAGIGLKSTGSLYAAELNGDVKLDGQMIMENSGDVELSMKNFGITNGRVLMRQNIIKHIVFGDIDNNNAGVYIRSAGANKMFFNPSGNIEVVSGNFISLSNANALGTSSRRWNRLYSTFPTDVSSDLRLKKNVQVLNYGIADVMKLRPVIYGWKSDSKEQSIGLIAQEVKEIIPEIVNTPDHPDQFLSMSYTELIPVLINALQEQQKIITEQKTKLEIQEERFIKLEQRIQQLESLSNESLISADKSE